MTDVGWDPREKLRCAFYSPLLMLCHTDSYYHLAQPDACL